MIRGNETAVVEIAEWLRDINGTLEVQNELLERQVTALEALTTHLQNVESDLREVALTIVNSSRL